MDRAPSLVRGDVNDTLGEPDEEEVGHHCPQPKQEDQQDTPLMPTEDETDEVKHL